MYTTPDCQAATPLQVAVAVAVVVFVGEAALLVAVVLPAEEKGEVVFCDVGCVDDPPQALTAILVCG